MSENLTKEKVERYIGLTGEAFEKIRECAPEKTYAEEMAGNFLEMARAYFSDSKTFYADGDLVNAFACVNYAHGWLDAGARLGLFDTGGDDRLFTLLR